MTRSMASNSLTWRRLLFTTSLLSLLFARSLQDDFLFLSEPPRWLYTYNGSIAILSCEAFRVDSDGDQHAVVPRLFRNSVQLDQYDMPPRHLALASDDGVVIGTAVNPTSYNDSGSTYHCALPNNGQSSAQATLYVGDGLPFATTLEFVDQHLYSVDLMWDQAPSPPDAPILGYIITVRGPNEPEFNVTIETNVTQAELLHLQPGTEYRVSIVPKNFYGYGERSAERTVFTLQPIVPSPPTDVRATLQLTEDSSSIIVTWTLSEIDPEVMTPVEQYVIFYELGSSLHNTSTTDSTTRTLTLTNLTSGSYTIGVAAVNSAGLSPIAYTSDALVVCNRVNPPENGSVTMTTTRTEYSCSEGYELVGNSDRTCQSDGTWSGSDPQCELLSTADEDSQYSVVLIAAIVVIITLLITIIIIIVIVMFVIRRRMKGLKGNTSEQGSPSIKKKKQRKMNGNTRSDNSPGSTIASSDIALQPTPEPTFLTSQSLEITIEEPSTSTFQHVSCSQS